MNATPADSAIDSRFEIARDQAAGRAGSWQVTALLGVLLLLPALTYYSSGMSMGIGTAVAAGIVLITLLLSARSPIRANILVTCALVGVVIVAHLTIAALAGPIEVPRAFGSLVLLEVILMAAFLLREAFATWSEAAVRLALGRLRVLFIVIAIMSLLQIQPPVGVGPIATIISALLSPLGIEIEAEAMDMSLFAKPIFPFTEPSYFALAFTPLLIHACISNTGWRRYLWLGGAAILAYFLESLSLVVGVVITAMACLPLNRLVPLAVLAVLGIGAVDITYFTDRLTFTYDTTNRSVLAYIQGWELMTDSLSRTWGWGVGFQQLGFGPINSPASDILLRMLGTDANVKEGSFNAAKTISEFGVFGVAIVVAYLAFAARCGLLLRRIASDPGRASPMLIFACAMACGYAVEAFVRGIGYLTGTTLLMVTSWLYMRGGARRGGEDAAPPIAS